MGSTLQPSNQHTSRGLRPPHRILTVTIGCSAGEVLTARIKPAVKVLTARIKPAAGGAGIHLMANVFESLQQSAQGVNDFLEETTGLDLDGDGGVGGGVKCQCWECALAESVGYVSKNRYGSYCKDR